MRGWRREASEQKLGRFRNRDAHGREREKRQSEIGGRREVGEREMCDRRGTQKWSGQGECVHG